MPLDVNPYAVDEESAKPSKVTAIENPGHQIKANIVFDQEYLTDLWARIRDRGPASLDSIGFYASVGAVALMALVGAAFGKSYLVSAAILLMVTVALILRPPRFVNVYLMQRLTRNTPYLNEKLAITLTDQSFHVASSLQQGGLAWSSFSKVVGFPDGVVVYRGKKPTYWIPIKSLENSSDASILYGFVKSRIEASEKRE